MSNLSVLERLEKEIEAYEAGKCTRQQFVCFLTSSIEALEGVPYQVRVDLRAHERAIETEGYFEEEGFEAEPEKAKEALRKWILQLKSYSPS